MDPLPEKEWTRALADRFEILVCAFFGGALGEVPDGFLEGAVPERNSVMY